MTAATPGQAASSRADGRGGAYGDGRKPPTSLERAWPFRAQATSSVGPAPSPGELTPAFLLDVAITLTADTEAYEQVREHDQASNADQDDPRSARSIASDDHEYDARDRRRDREPDAHDGEPAHERGSTHRHRRQLEKHAARWWPAPCSQIGRGVGSGASGSGWGDGAGGSGSGWGGCGAGAGRGSGTGISAIGVIIGSLLTWTSCLTTRVLPAGHDGRTSAVPGLSSSVSRPLPGRSS
jgi:hypothetical protein